MPSMSMESSPTDIILPEPLVDGSISVEKAIFKRRSIRTYRASPLSLAEVSQLLWAAQGITHPKGFRSVPSAGALYPLEMYMAIGHVSNLDSGIYHYRPHDHKLILVQNDDKRTVLCKAAWNQKCIKKAPVVIIVCAIFERVTGKYGNRGIQYVMMEAGHAAQNVSLQAVALQMGSVVIGAFGDQDVRGVLSLEKREQPLYLIPVGR